MSKRIHSKHQFNNRLISQHLMKGKLSGSGARKLSKKREATVFQHSDSPQLSVSQIHACACISGLQLS